ncbi:copper amine oxidase N-terminal domain-containing protein [Peptoniphilus equinus]|uniref:Copper amine oxidase N-terminal domain-containing protein n=1 Tax=Peptoniphilus equinus TaxID=3016343 RepID=A0ABY7QVL4_9FIRM|nr:copper amine oxidase N-terminal domain-containing protein [Peptoniphilus equinus]WBW50456.1 copper amine oxidase N-terminal domain-containing protein [Peptoniphilus equinus]
MKSWLLLLALFVTTPVFAQSAEPVAVLSIDVPGDKAFIDAQTSLSMVPVRYICESLGAKVLYLEGTADRLPGFTITTAEVDLRMFETSSRAYVNHAGSLESVQMGAPVVNIEGTNYVPLRYLAETLGYDVAWQPTDHGGTVTLSH